VITICIKRRVGKGPQSQASAAGRARLWRKMDFIFIR